MAEFEERFSECVRVFPVLYDKECADFKDRNKKSKAWECEANTMGMTKEEATTYFRNLRNKYSREKKKVQKVKVSGTGKKEVDDVKSELSDIFPYLQWLDPYIRVPKTKTNFVVDVQDSDSEHEVHSEISDVSMETRDTEISSETSQSDSNKNEEGASNKSQVPSWKFHKQKHTDKDSKKKKLDREEAEFNLIKSLGESIVKQKEEKKRYI